MNQGRDPDDRLPAPSKTWVKNFMKAHRDFHMIKWKPLDKKRRAAQDTSSVLEWFKEYEALRKTYNIRAQDLWNFDETGFRLACPGGLEVWVPVEITEVSS
jgi:hypothetical protein